ncbi:hypothetical protein [Sodalinema gerasimenkoae]|uniref:hypothetical protein n=1 Tax=Sodalinema gerasimenkoae TaxID=2862348 RepID=UPI00135A85ED|nr:hypothetical protein [Sodalinema gerasimenkoae]
MDIAGTRTSVANLLSWILFAVTLVPGGFLGYLLRRNGVWIGVGLWAFSLLLPFPTAELATISHRGFTGLAAGTVLGYLGLIWQQRQAQDSSPDAE